MAKRPSATTGETPIDRLNALLRKVWRSPMSIKSDYARTHAVIVAMAASLRMISTKVREGVFASRWHITVTGLSWMKEQESK